MNFILIYMSYMYIYVYSHSSTFAAIKTSIATIDYKMSYFNDPS